jgi:carboxyl-terminal processing protease
MTDAPSHGALKVSALVTVGMLSGALAGNAAVARVTDPYQHLDVLARVLTTVQTDYVEPLPPEVLVEAAIEGVMDSLDAQSRWLSAEQLQDLQDDAEGAKTGIGVAIRPAEQGVEVLEVLPDSPARRDGIEPGDRIIAIDGTKLGGLTLDDISEAFRGLRGEQTTLTVLREGVADPLQIATVREPVAQPAVEVAPLGDVVYARIEQFQDGVADDLLDLVTATHPTPSGLLLDLRDNPGGLLSQAVAVTDLFLDDGLIVATRARPGTAMNLEEHHATPGGFDAELPVVVLVNGMSASASEIVAAALQDTGRATLVGERTYGKGSVQKVYTHLDPSRPGAEAALKLTVGWYTTPSGEPVAPREGRVPDIEVPFPRAKGPKQTLLDELDALPDDVRERLAPTVAQLPDDRVPRAALLWSLPPEERVASDPQLQRALDHLQGR